MRMILAGMAAAALLAIVAAGILSMESRRAYEVFATSGTRVGTPGNNLVGPDWSGLNAERDTGRPPAPK